MLKHIGIAITVSIGIVSGLIAALFGIASKDGSIQSSNRPSPVTKFVTSAPNIRSQVNGASISAVANNGSATAIRSVTESRPLAKPADAELRARATAAYAKLPLHFEANQGQTDPQVKFLSRGREYSLFLSATEAILTLQHESASNQTPGTRTHAQGVTSDEPTSSKRAQSSRIRMKLLGANPTAEIVGEEPLRGKSNYFYGSDPNSWHLNVPQFAKVRYLQVYPGIDLVYYGNQGSLEYDFVVSPGANPSDIQLELQGADKISVDASGDLILTVSANEVRLRKPFLYQRIDDEVQEISGGYVLDSLSAASKVSFQVASHYDPNQTLVIDPILAFSKRTGGQEGAGGYGIAVDALGHAYVTGYTNSLDFPVTTGALQSVHQGGFNEVFIMKLTPDGNGIVYSTFLGGSGQDFGYGIAVDASGNAYVTGETNSPDFPVTPGAVQSVRPGNLSAFVAKLNSDGTALLYSTYLGGDTMDRGHGISVDSFGNAYVAGMASSNFPITAGAYQSEYGGNGDAFVSKLSSNGSLVYSTYLGGADFERVFGVAVDLSGNAIVTGHTGSLNFPISPQAALADYSGWGDGFVTKLNSSGSALIYSTYLGGDRSDIGNAIAVDAAGNAYITGETESLNFPTTNGSFQPLHTCSLPTTPGSWCSDAFVTKLSPSGAIVYSTFLGGRFTDRAYGIAVDSFGNAYVTGETFTAMFTVGGQGLTLSEFPVTEDAFQPVAGQVDDGFVTKLNSTGSALVYSSHLGGNGSDRPLAIAVDIEGNAYVTGWTGSGSEFPTWPEGIRFPSLFITKISPSFQLNASEFTISEDGGVLTATVTRSGSTEGEVTVGFTTSDETAKAGLDYSLTSGVLTFADGETSKTITVTLLDDAVLEGNESFRISLRNPSGNFGLGGANTSNVTIDDNDFENLTEYFPSAYGDVWSYRRVEDGAETQIAVLAQNVDVNGVMASVFENSADGSQEYYSLDANGLRLHRLFTPKVPIEGLGRVDLTFTFNPPITFANLISEVGQTFSSSGTARTNPLRRIGVFEFPYNASFVFAGIETISVPAGSYDVLRLQGSISLAGESPTVFEMALAKNIGRVRWISDYLGVSETLEMTATTVGVHNFAVTKITPPKTVTLTARSPAQTKQIKVQIQNRGPRTETIRDLTTLGQLVSLEIESLGSCGTPTAILSARQSGLPITLKPNKSLAVAFDVHFTCANDRTGGRGHEDFLYRATLHPAVLQSGGELPLPPQPSTASALTDVIVR